MAGPGAPPQEEPVGVPKAQALRCAARRPGESAKGDLKPRGGERSAGERRPGAPGSKAAPPGPTASPPWDSP
eukprot:6493504-Alexandrium_andersonii.AAC.1